MQHDYLQYDSTFSVHHEMMDREHEQLITIINGYLDELRYITGAEARKEALIDLFQAALSQMKHHCASEEALLAQTSYPLLKEHKVQHNNLYTYLEITLRTIEEVGDINLAQVLFIVQKQMESHFKIFDAGYIPYLSPNEGSGS